MKCFACEKQFGSGKRMDADTRDGQVVWVGPDCFKKIVAAGDAGYQPPKGGPRLWLVARASGES